MNREVTIEKKGGVETPLRLFAVVWEIRGWEKIKIAETEVVVRNGMIEKKEKKETKGGRGNENIQPNSFKYILYPEGKNNLYIIAEVNSGVSRHTKIVPNEGKANAQLIAAAPEMYVILADIAKAIDEGKENIGVGREMVLRQALAKAEGR